MKTKVHTPIPLSSKYSRYLRAQLARFRENGVDIAHNNINSYCSDWEIFRDIILCYKYPVQFGRRVVQLCTISCRKLFGLRYVRYPVELCLGSITWMYRVYASHAAPQEKKNKSQFYVEGPAILCWYSVKHSRVQGKFTLISKFRFSIVSVKLYLLWTSTVNYICVNRSIASLGIRKLIAWALSRSISISMGAI